MNYSRRSLENLYSGIAGKPVTQRAHLSVFGEETNTPEETREVEVTIENIHKALDNLATDIEDSSELKKLYNRILNFSSYKHIKRSLTDKGYSDLIYKKFSNDIHSKIVMASNKSYLRILFNFVRENYQSVPTSFTIDHLLSKIDIDIT